jgi:hypothetical protein
VLMASSCGWLSGQKVNDDKFNLIEIIIIIFIIIICTILKPFCRCSDVLWSRKIDK